MKRCIRWFHRIRNIRQRSYSWYRRLGRHQSRCRWYRRLGRHQSRCRWYRRLSRHQSRCRSVSTSDNEENERKKISIHRETLPVGRLPVTVAFSPSEIGRGMKAVPNQSHLEPREKNAIQLSRFNGLYHMTEATAMTKSIQEQTPDAPVVDHIWVAPTSEGPETVLFLNHKHFDDIQMSIKRDQRVLQNRTIARQLLSKITDQVAEKWLRKSEQGDKWNRCLIEGMIVLSETGARDEQTTPP